MSGQQEQIDILNMTVKASLAPSDIHGVGVFAIRDILKGERLYVDSLAKVYTVPYSSLGKLFPEIKDIILERWPSIINGSKFIAPDARLLSFMNHGGKDCNYNQVDDTAKCDISSGDEITEDYTLMPNWQKIYPWLKTTYTT